MTKSGIISIIMAFIWLDYVILDEFERLVYDDQKTSFFGHLFVV